MFSVISRSRLTGQAKGIEMAAQLRKPLATDVSLEMATRAHAGTSHTPDRRGESEVADYILTIENFNAKLEAAADTEARMVEAVAQSEMYRENYIKRLSALWSSRSRMVSTMIAGPANFPVRRQEKAWNAYENRAKEFYAWQDRALKAALKAIKAVDAPAPVVDPNAKTGAESKVIGGVEIIQNFDLDRVQIIFGGKPDSDTIENLKGAGWNWSPRNSAWQRKLTNNAIYSADRIVAKLMAAA